MDEWLEEEEKEQNDIHIVGTSREVGCGRGAGTERIGS